MKAKITWSILWACVLMVILMGCQAEAVEPESATEPESAIEEAAVNPTATERAVAPTPTDRPTEAPSATPELPTPTEEPTNTPAPTATATERPTDTPTPTSAPTETPAPTATATEMPQPEVSINSNSANVRGGPGTNYGTVGVLREGDVVTVMATSNDGSWYNVELADGSTGWLAASVSDPVDEAALAQVPVAATIPAPPPPPPTAVPVAPTETPVPAAGGAGIVVTFVNQTPNRDVDVRIWDCCDTINVLVPFGETVVHEMPAGDYGWGVSSGSCRRDLPNIHPDDRAITLFFIPTDGDCDWYISSMGLGE